MSDKASMSAARQRAIEIIGGTTATARVVGCTPQAVDQWEICPPARVLALEAATGGAVSRHQLRPDIYGASGQLAEAQP